MPMPRAAQPLRNPIATRVSDACLADIHQRRGNLELTAYIRWALDVVRENDYTPEDKK